MNVGKLLCEMMMEVIAEGMAALGLLASEIYVMIVIGVADWWRQIGGANWLWQIGGADW